MAPNVEEIVKGVVESVYPVTSHTTILHMECVPNQVSNVEPLKRDKTRTQFSAKTFG